jgi:hypothetical protein
MLDGIMRVSAKRTSMTASSTRRVRRDHAGGKRPEGHRLQLAMLSRFPGHPAPGEASVPRATGSSWRDVASAAPIHAGSPPEPRTGPSPPWPGSPASEVTSGTSGWTGTLARLFGRLKRGGNVVCPMASQLRLLLDAHVAGEDRVFGIEALAGDPLFVHLAGGRVPSIDTLYRDLERFDDDAIEDLSATRSPAGE